VNIKIIEFARGGDYIAQLRVGIDWPRHGVSSRFKTDRLYACNGRGSDKCGWTAIDYRS